MMHFQLISIAFVLIPEHDVLWRPFRHVLGFQYLICSVCDSFLIDTYCICAFSWLWCASGLISCCSYCRCSASRRSSPWSRMRLRRWPSRQQLSLAEGAGRLFGETANVINDLGRVLRLRKLGTYFWSHQKLVSYYRSILLAVRSSGVIVSYVCVEACAFWSLHWGLGCHDL